MAEETSKLSRISASSQGFLKGVFSVITGLWQRIKRPSKVSLILSHWHRLFEDWQGSSQQIYSQLEEAIKQLKIDGVKMSKITYREGGILSAKRQYLRVSRKELIFDICAAPFGTCFFVSWWLGEKPGRIAGLILYIPILGPLLIRAFKPQTYFQLDTTYMFQDAVHTKVLDVIEQIIQGEGIKALTEDEKKPIMQDLFKQKLS